MQELDYQSARNLEQSGQQTWPKGEWLRRGQEPAHHRPCGCGKTYLQACALGCQACQQAT